VSRVAMCEVRSRRKTAKNPKKKKKRKVASSKKKKTTINPIWRKIAACPVDRTASWCIGDCLFALALHPIHKIPERDFLDGALVDAGSLRPVLGHSSQWN